MNLSQAIHILGGNFAKCKVKQNRGYSDRKDGGLSISFHYTKMYGKNIWWTSESVLIADSFNYTIIALQRYGLLVLPCKVLISYWEELNVSYLKSGRRNIRIKEENGNIYLYNSKDQNDVDVTQYLRQCEVK